MIPPNVTHAPCDLEQQRRRLEARRASVAREVALRSGQRTMLDRLLRRRLAARELPAEDAARLEGEDVLHALRY